MESAHFHLFHKTLQTLSCHKFIWIYSRSKTGLWFEKILDKVVYSIVFIKWLCGIVLGPRDSMVNKMDKFFLLLELILYWQKAK